MARIRGSQKTPQSGRKKGTPNKRTLALIEKLEELDFEIPRELYRLVNRLEEISVNPLRKDEELKAITAMSHIYLEMLQYVYPKRKAIEVREEEPDDTSISVSLDLEDDAEILEPENEDEKDPD